MTTYRMYTITLTRYVHGERDISDQTHLTASSFKDAVHMADLMCHAAKDADPRGGTYEVLSVELSGIPGNRCKNRGGGIWQREADSE